MSDQSLRPSDNSQQKRIEDYRRKIAASRERILRLLLDAERIRQETRSFAHEYNARVGRFYVELDRVHLEIKEVLYRARLLERGFVTSLEHLDRRVREAFRAERRRVEEYDRTVSESADEKEPRPRPPREHPSQHARRLYLRLAKQYHPDKAADEATRRDFVALMAFINQAYEDGDTSTLERLAMALPGREAASESPNDRERRLYREYLRLHRAVADLEHEVATLEGNHTYQLRLDVERGRRQGTDPLANLQREITAKLEAAKCRLVLIRQQVCLLAARLS
jgi:hypothetical protein